MEARLTNRYDREVLDQRRIEKQQARAEAVRRGEFRPFTLVETSQMQIKRIEQSMRFESECALLMARELGVDVPKKGD